MGPQFKTSDSDLSVLLADHGKRAESSQAPSTPVGAEAPSGGPLLSPGRLHSSAKRHTLREMTLEHEKRVATVKYVGKLRAREKVVCAVRQSEGKTRKREVKRRERGEMEQNEDE